ncbi:hypothetical protein AAHA92_15686 [Salvia divinorum]
MSTHCLTPLPALLSDGDFDYALDQVKEVATLAGQIRLCTLLALLQQQKHHASKKLWDHHHHSTLCLF